MYLLLKVEVELGVSGSEGEILNLLPSHETHEVLYILTNISSFITEDSESMEYYDVENILKIGFSNMQYSTFL